MNYIPNKKILTFVSGWTALGFYRGTQDYNYKYTQEIKMYNEEMSKYTNDLERYHKDIIEYPKIQFRKPIQPFERFQNKFVTTTIIVGLYGSILYLFPFTGACYFVKEFYRAEIYLRKLDGEKMKRYFNTLDLESYN